MGGRK